MSTKEEKMHSRLSTYCHFLDSADKLQGAIYDFSDAMQKHGLIERSDLDVLRDAVLDLNADIHRYCEPYLREAELLWSKLYDEEKC